ncbi:MAG TPA: nitrile hydratase subunit beta [Roseiarcus sp.]|nr:nitrile hydratase subunit beta [Roseiarcus sp.]
MDGVHDLGGREGFGPIAGKADDKVIHAEWEIRDFGIKQSSAAGQAWTIDWFRHCRELADPVDYLTRPYYDQWLTTLAAQLVDEGYLTLDEIKRGALAFTPRPGRPPQTPEAARASVKDPRSFVVNVNAPPRFALGQTVRCRLDGGSGHTRLPGYVRGRAGAIHAHHGGHVLADASARGEKRGEHLYTVSFASADLWPEAKGSLDRVFVDLWESYLEPA